MASGIPPTGEHSTPPPQDETQPALSRRDFLARSLAVTLGLASGGAAALAAWLLHRRPPPRTFRGLSRADNPHLREARYWRTACAGVQCTLCPFECFLPEGARGICRVRMNVEGRLVTMVYGHPVAVHVDPMEKKPVFHLLPASLIYSLAAVGCSLRCAFCQNWEISQIFPEEAQESVPVPRELRLMGLARDGRRVAALRQEEAKTLAPEEIVAAARATRCRSVAYTYSEPAVFFEYVLDAAALAKRAGLRNVLVTCGYVNPKPLAEMAAVFDVIKVDLKGFNERFYRRVVGGELRFVLRTLLELKRLRVMTEIVNLVVPTLNDDAGEIRAMCAWIRSNLGPDVPLFFSRFTPQYRMQNLPPTPVETLTRAREAALREGLNYVYVGNVPGHPGEHTYCPRCRRILVRRRGFAVLEDRISPTGRCPWDGTRIPGIWN